MSMSHADTMRMWWIGVVEEVNEVEEDVKINFLHPPGPERSFSLAKQT